MKIALSLLDEAEIKKIHTESIKLLETHGIYLPHEETLQNVHAPLLAVFFQIC